MKDAGEYKTFAALLAWYGEMGVTDVVGEEPVDWLAGASAGGVPGTDVTAAIRAAAAPQVQPAHEQAKPAAKPAAAPAAALRPPPSVFPAGTSGRRFPTAAPDEAVMAARSAARSAQSLGELKRILAGFDGCALKATAKNLCFFRGTEKARLMIIGEAPGRDEDLEGKPFVGRAGMLLDKMLGAINLSEPDVHITNIVYWRPPGNRTPTPLEAQVCRPFLERQVELVGPDFILLLGGAAAKQILGVTDGIMRLRGRWRDLQIGTAKAKALATLHPAYLLRTPAAKRLAWRDLLAIREKLNGGE